MSNAVVVYLYILFLLLAFLSDILPFLSLAKIIFSVSTDSFKVIRSDLLDDKQKEHFLLNNSAAIFINSIKIIGLILLLLLCGLLLLLVIAICNRIDYITLIKYTTNFDGLKLAVIAFLTYYLLKKLYVGIRL